MKKLLTILGILIFSSAAVNAQETYVQCAAPYKVSHGMSKFFTTVTGTDFIADKAAEALIAKGIRAESQGDFDVKLESFGAAALAAGKFHSLTVTGKDIISDGVYISYLKVKTICDYNHIVINSKNKSAEFKENFGLYYGAILTEEDINNSMKSTVYNEAIEQINSVGSSFNLFKIASTKVKVLDNKFIFVIKILFPAFGASKNIVVSSDINVSGGKIIFTHVDLLNKNAAYNLNKITYLLNNLNPLNFTLRILENKDAQMSVKDAYINDNKIYVSGIITVDKDVVTERKGK